MPPIRTRTRRKGNAKVGQAKVSQLTQIQKPRAQTLPHDVLSEIFLNATHSSFPFSWNGSGNRVEDFGMIFITPNPQLEPYTFTLVCKSWREAALSTTRLWSQIAIDIGFDCKPKEGFRLLSLHHKRVSSWLKLSRNSPLFLRFNIHMLMGFPDCIIKSIPRIEFLGMAKSCHWTKNYIHNILNVTISDKAQNLRQLELPVFDDCFMVNLKLSNFPRLKRLGGVVMPVLEPETSYNLQSLRGSWGGDGCIKLLTLLPGLKRFEAEFDSSETSSDWLSPLTDVMSPSYITSLRLCKDIHILMAIFHAVEFLALKEAKICIPAQYSTYLIQTTTYRDVKVFSGALEKLFTGSSSTLTHLVLDWALFGLDTMINTLRLAQSLTHLTLHTEGITDTGLSALEWIDSREQNACPNLVFLKITVTHYVKLREVHRNDSGRPELSVEQLIKIVRSRVEKHKEFFMHLGLVYYDPFDFDLFSENAELMEFGKQGVLELLLKRLPRSSG